MFVAVAVDEDGSMTQPPDTGSGGWGEALALDAEDQRLVACDGGEAAEAGEVVETSVQPLTCGSLGRRCDELPSRVKSLSAPFLPLLLLLLLLVGLGRYSWLCEVVNEPMPRELPSLRPCEDPSRWKEPSPNPPSSPAWLALELVDGRLLVKDDPLGFCEALRTFSFCLAPVAPIGIMNLREEGGLEPLPARRLPPLLPLASMVNELEETERLW